jgi:DNA-binding transcriptional MerR regulator
MKVGQVGLSLEEIRDSLSSLPQGRTPTEADRRRLAKSWQPRIDAQIGVLERLRDRLSACIGCGCLSLKVCRIVNADDIAGTRARDPATCSTRTDLAPAPHRSLTSRRLEVLPSPRRPRTPIRDRRWVDRRIDTRRIGPRSKR